MGAPSGALNRMSGPKPGRRRMTDMAKSENVRFCEGLLRSYKAEAKEKGIELGKLTVYREMKGHGYHYYNVYEDGPWAGDWADWATCAADAKVKYIRARIADVERQAVAKEDAIAAELVKAGYTLTETGGGCTAFIKTVNDECYFLLTIAYLHKGKYETEPDHPRSWPAFIGFYDDESDFNLSETFNTLVNNIDVLKELEPRILEAYEAGILEVY